jgi:serine/threonine protein kinase
MSTNISARYQILETLNQGQVVIALDPQIGVKVKLDSAPVGVSSKVSEPLANELIKRYSEIDHRLQRPTSVTVDLNQGEARTWMVSPLPKGEPVNSYLDDQNFRLSAKIQLISDLVRVMASFIELGGQPIYFTTHNLFIDQNAWTLSDLTCVVVNEWYTQLAENVNKTIIGVDEQDGFIYSSPEQITEGIATASQTAVYRLGLVLFELIAGHPPYAGDMSSLMQQHVTATVPHLELSKTLVNDALSDKLSSLLSKMMNKAANDRPSWLDLLTELAGLKQSIMSFEEERADQIINGRYELVEEIGRGGFGVVHRALDLNISKREVAIKQLTLNALENKQVVTLFDREARVLSRLGNPNTLTLLDYGINRRGQPFMVSEFLKGKQLNDHIKSLETKRLKPAVALQVIIAMCEALGEAHGLGVVHRDIKPENIFVSAQGVNRRRLNVKLLDFGISKIREEAQQGTLSDDAKTNGFMGTFEYMSPEQFEDTGNVDHRTDFYSLGLVFYECLIGVRPFLGNTPYLLITQHREEPVPAVELNLESEINQEFNDIISWMTAKDREKRPKSATELIERLQIIEDELKIGQAQSLRISKQLSNAAIQQANKTIGLKETKVGQSQGKSKVWIAILGVALVLGLGGVAIMQMSKASNMTALNDASSDQAKQPLKSDSKTSSPTVNTSHKVSEPDKTNKSISGIKETTQRSTVRKESKPKEIPVSSKEKSTRKPKKKPRKPKLKTVTIKQVTKGFSFSPGSSIRFKALASPSSYSSKIRYVIKPKQAGKMMGSTLKLTKRSFGKASIRACVSSKCSRRITIRELEEAPE